MRSRSPTMHGAGSGARGAAGLGLALRPTANWVPTLHSVGPSPPAGKLSRGEQLFPYLVRKAGLRRQLRPACHGRQQHEEIRVLR